MKTAAGWVVSSISATKNNRLSRKQHTSFGYFSPWNSSLGWTLKWIWLSQHDMEFFHIWRGFLRATLRVRSQDAWWTFTPLLRKCMKSIQKRPLMDLQVDSSLSVGTYGHHQNITPVFEARFQQVGTSEQVLWSLWAVQIHLVTVEVCVVGVAIHLCFLEVYPQSRGNNERRHSVHNSANILKEIPDKNSSFSRRLIPIFYSLLQVGLHRYWFMILPWIFAKMLHLPSFHPLQSHSMPSLVTGQRFLKSHRRLVMVKIPRSSRSK